MPDLFRVFPFIAGAAPGEPGGVRYVPRHRQGGGRVDNPEIYGVAYFAADPAAAVAERIQGFRGRTLSARDLRVRVGGRPAVLALARMRAPAAECDLDSPAALARRTMVPSDVATRRRATTQGWARAIYEEHAFRGVRYWSAIEAKWPVIARWSLDGVRVESIETLTVFHPALREAARQLDIGIGRGR